jgi:hypothetical protein
MCPVKRYKPKFPEVGTIPHLVGHQALPGSTKKWDDIKNAEQILILESHIKL